MRKMKRFLCPEAILFLVLFGLVVLSPNPVMNGADKAKKESVQELSLKLDFVEQQVQNLYDRTEDLNERLKRFETPEGHDKANFRRFQAELNGIDARVAQLERPEPEQDAN